MIYISEDKTINFDNFKYNTAFYENTPSQEQRTYRVINKDEDIIFTNGLKNKRIQLNLFPIDTNIQNRMLLFRELKAEFLKGGHIILDRENDVKYKCKVLNGTNIRYSGTYDTISINLDLSPTALRSLEVETLTWDTATVSWNLANFNWNQEEYTIPSGTGSFTLTNKGNYKSNPLFVIDGNVTITCNGNSFQTINNSGETIYVDSDKMIVYNDLKVNRISRFVGDFIELIPGDNTVDVVVTTGNALLDLKNVSRWV